MTSKEKAEELVDKMYFSRRYKDEENYIPKQAFIYAKQCALIAQKNLLEKLKSLNITDEFEENVLLEINVL
jgi:hypothetical protein